MIETSVMVGVVIALAQVVKQLELMPVKFIPLADLFFGVALCLLYPQGDLKTALFKGVVVGLTASGLFSSGKNILQSQSFAGNAEEEAGND